MKMKKKRYQIYIEGFARREAGPAGIGIIVTDPEGKTVRKISENIGSATLDQARFKSFVRALKVIRQLKISSARIYTSSLVLVRQVQGIYKVMDPVLKHLKKIIKEKYSDLKYQIVRISSSKNTEAFNLAQKAAGEPDETADSSDIPSDPIKMFPYSPPVREEKKASQAVQRSAGGVVYKKEGSRIKVCLIAKRNRAVWALPKGRVAENETPPETAVREVIEETGHRAKIQMKLDEIDYYFYWKENNTFYHKFVYFYLMPLVEENVRPRDSEADAVVWLTPGAAYKKATYINEKEVIRKAREIFEARA